MENSLDQLLNVSAVPQNDRVAAFIAESKNNRSRCYEMSEQMTAAVATDGQMFKRYLDVQSRFDRYTANNALLIMAQKPDAQRLGDYSYWKDQGIYVKRTERQNPVLIMEPGKEHEREDGSIGTYYNAKKLYDVSQTTMREKVQEQPETDERLLVRAVISSPPADIVAADPDQMPEGKGAWFEPEEGCIYVRKGMSAPEIIRSIVPELALAGFADGNKNYDCNEDMFHAYCTSYIICKKCGLDTQDFDFTEAPQVFEGMEPQEVRAELSKIRNAANAISSRMAKVLEQNRMQNGRETATEQGQPQTQQAKEQTQPQSHARTQPWAREAAR